MKGSRCFEFADCKNRTHARKAKSERRKAVVGNGETRDESRRLMADVKNGRTNSWPRLGGSEGRRI